MPRMKRVLPLVLPFAALAACTSSSAGPSSGDGGPSSSDDASITGDDGATGGDDGGTGLDGDAGVPDTFAWADVFPAGEGSDVLAMASDPSGVVVVGQITGTATLGTTTLTATDDTGNAFVAKLDPSGNVLWAKIASGSQSAFEAVVLDASGNITLSGDDYGDTLPGSASSSFTFAGTTLTPNYANGTIGGSAVSAAAGVVARLDPSGNLTWMKMAETTTIIDMGSLVLSGANVVVAGANDGNAAFGAGETMPITCTTATQECVYLAAYDGATGTPKWALVAPSTPARGNGGSNPHQVQAGVDGSGNVFLGIGGYFEGVGSTDDTELVVNKYDPTGTLTWNKVFMAGGGDTPELAGFAVDTTGNSYVLGNQAAGLVLGTTTIDSNETGDFLAKLDPTGAVTWAETLDSNPAGTTGIALGSSVFTFGNGDDPASILPDTVVSMNLGKFDLTTGQLSSSVTCGIAHAQGKVVAVNGTSTYVAGDGSSPGVFGHVQTSAGDAGDAGDGGLFVAKLK